MLLILKLIVFLATYFTLTLEAGNKKIKPGTLFQLECPAVAIKQITNMRTYALVLNNAQRNMEIKIFIKKQAKKYGLQSKFDWNKKQLEQIQSKSQLSLQCILNKDQKVCVLDGFINEISINCSSSGTISLLIVEPVMISSNAEEEVVKERVIAPVLNQNQKGILIFRPNINIDLTQSNLEDIFISNCIEQIDFFQHEFLLGVKGTRKIDIILTSDGTMGEWIFTQINNIITESAHITQTYSLPGELAIFEIENAGAEDSLESKANNNFYGFKLLLCSENRTLIQNLSIEVTGVLKIENQLFSEEELNQTILINSGDLTAKLPIKIAFFYQEHPLHKIILSFNSALHYKLQLSQPRQKGQKFQNRLPVMEEDEYFYYSYQLKKKAEVLKVEAHVVKSFQTKLTPTLRAITDGVDKIIGVQKKQLNQTPTSNLIPLVNEKIPPMRINNNDSYAEFVVHLQVSGNQKQMLAPLQESQQQSDSKVKFLKIMLETSFSLIEIKVGDIIDQFLFENELKRFIIFKQNMEKVASKQLKVVCASCHAFLTYNSNCTNINCCEYAHADQVEVKSSNLMIIVVSSTHLTDTALIKLQLYEDQKAFTLHNGEIVEGMLTNFDNYIFQSDGKDQVQIMFNSQVQSILMLAIVNRNQFPTKNSFDYQSNQGYIRIPPTKKKGTIYLTLIKTVAAFELSSTNFKIPYSMVALTSKGYLNIKEGSQFTHILGRSAQKQYLLEHSCHSAQKLYLKIYPKSQTSLVGVNHDFSSPTLNIKIRLKDLPEIMVEKNMSQHGIFQITQVLEKAAALRTHTSIEDNQQICSVVVTMQNLLSETLSITSMFFKEKQIYQIYAGQFSRNQLLARKKLSLFCVVSPERETNIYAYSLLEEIMMKIKVVSVRELKLMEIYSDYLQEESENGQRQTDFFNQRFQILRQQDKKRPSHTQYVHLSPNKQLKGSDGHQDHNLMVIVIEISKNIQNGIFQRNDIYVICTQNQTVLRVGNRLHYQVLDGNFHYFLYPLSGELILGDSQKSKQLTFRNAMSNDKQIILQTTKLNGNYEVSVGLKYFGKLISNLSLFTKAETNSNSKQRTKSSGQEEPIVIIKTEAVRAKLSQYAKENKEKELQKIQFNNLYLEYKISCVKQTGKYCVFLTSLQTSQSDIRELTLGVPEIFHINKHSSIIFIYNNNLHDREFKFKVNRKLGFPNYKLCSYRPVLNHDELSRKEDPILRQPGQQVFSDLEAEDKCLSDLQNSENQLNLRIQENAFNSDSKLIVGRTHELIINQHNEQYCTNCTYYLGLYSDYDIVEGSIFVMSANQETLLEEGSSITTIVYRGQPDKYALINWESLMGIVYEIEGGVQVSVYYFDSTTKSKVVVLNKSSYKSLVKQDFSKTQRPEGINSNIITINLQENPTSSHHEYFVDIQTANNLPSALYTLVIMNKEEQVINIKDGVPYQMKYSLSAKQNQKEALELHPIIHYRYVCENEGIIMVSTKSFDDLEIQVNCRDHLTQEKEEKSIGDNLTNNDRKSERKGKSIEIKDLLTTKKLYKMSNRLDIMISPKICSKYQLTVTTKTPTISYKVLVSSTDIVTLPMNKQVPGTLKYQSKLYQIYEISVNEKTEVRCTFKFCQGGDGRIMIAKSKKNIYQEIYQSQIEINEDTTFETLKYTAKPGLFYIKIEFKASGGLMEYTIYVQSLANGQKSELSKENQKQSTNPLKIFKNINTISYKVLRVGYDYTDYEITFYPIVQKTGIFQIQYYIVQSTKLKLLKKTENCNGQYFEDLVSHHDQIRQTKINFTNPGNNSDGNQSKQTTLTLKQMTVGEREKLKFRYTTGMPYSFITIIPIVYNKQTHEFYHMYIPKYHEVELTNGQIFSKMSYIFSEIASKVEQVIDIHGSEYAIILILGIMFALCLLTTLLGGIWLGAKYFFKTKTVYVLKQIQQEDAEEEVENEDNGIQEEYNNNSATAIVSQPAQMQEINQGSHRIQQPKYINKNKQIQRQQEFSNQELDQ